MISNNVNLNHLRYFEVVYRTRSMTEAAKILHLTQSGISQHMKTLEESLGFILFDRVKLRLVPTQEGRQLFEKISKMIGDLEHCLSDIQSSKGKVYGKVRIGMPIEFGNNILAPLLAQIAHQHPHLHFVLSYGFVTEMNHKLLAGELDFAFIDAFNVDRRIKTSKVYNEVLHLCATKTYLKVKGIKNLKEKELTHLEFIDYQESGPLTELWFSHHYGLKKLNLNIKAAVMDVQGVARLIMGHMGAGVLPTHFIDQQDEKGNELVKFVGSGTSLINTISLAQIKEHTLSPAADYVLKYLMEELA